MKAPIPNLISAIVLIAIAAANAEVRTFTSSAGTTLKGELVSVVGDTVTIKKEDGTPLALKLTAFSRVDQAWLQTQTTAAPAGASDPAKATKDAPFVNSLGMKFVPVPATNVLFCIHETRYKDYVAYAAENPGSNEKWKEQTAEGFKPVDRTLEHPVVCVSYEDTHAFCAWLSKKEGKTYRLPVDREWSNAVGIGRLEGWTANTTPEMLSRKIADIFPWGRQWPPPKDTGNFCDQSFKALPSKPSGRYLKDYDDGHPTTAPVMSFPPNQYGLYDLAGNVHEWVEDWYDAKQESRVLRGSSWLLSDRDNLASSHRHYNSPTNRLNFNGFRCVLELGKP